MSRRAGALRVLLTAAVLGLVLAGCDGGGGVSLPSERPGSGLPTLPTEASRPTLPSVTAPTRTVVPPPLVTTTAPPTTPGPPTTTAPPTTAPPSTAPPTTVPPPTPPPTAPPPTTAAPSSTAPTASPTPTATASAAAVPVASSSTPPAWVWWLLGVLLAIIVAVLVVMAVRARRARKAWEARLAEVVTESTWLAHEFLPYALGGGPAVSGRDVWAAFRPRVHALVNNLNEVVASASKDRMAAVDRLRAAVTDVSAAMDGYAAAGPQDRESLGAARQAHRQLEEALRVLQPPPPVSGP